MQKALNTFKTIFKMTVTTFRKKKIELEANDIVNLEYIKSQLQAYAEKELSYTEVIRFLIQFFMRVDEAISKTYDEIGE
jgi:uncharacterized protein YdiU (UPF0061 family)